MTTCTGTFLICDGCGGVYDTSTVPSVASARQARARAEAAGWQAVSAGEDLCPDCAQTQLALRCPYCPAVFRVPPGRYPETFTQVLHHVKAEHPRAFARRTVNELQLRTRRVIVYG